MPIRPIRKTIIEPDQGDVRPAFVGRPEVRSRARLRLVPAPAPAQSQSTPPADRLADPAPAKKPENTKIKQPASADGDPKPKKEKREKNQPTGDYDTGYCKPPVKNRFDGSTPGPGRPKGAKSQDTLLKKHLSLVRSITVEGKTTKVQQRELAIMLRVKEALKGDKHALDYTLLHSQRLFGDGGTGSAAAGQGAASTPADLDAHDQAMLAELEAILLARLARDAAGGAGEPGELSPSDDDEPGDQS